MAVKKLLDENSLLAIKNYVDTYGGNIDDVQVNSVSIVNNKVANLAVDGTYNASTNKVASVSTVTGAINALDVTIKDGSSTNFGAGKTLKTLSETDGKISATLQDIQITESQVTDLSTHLSSINTALGTKAPLSRKITDDLDLSSDISTSQLLASLGLTRAMTYIGEATTSTPPSHYEYIQTTISGTTLYIVLSASGSGEVAAQLGQIFTYNYKEYICTVSGLHGTNSFIEMGDESSYALKTIQITGTGALSGGGTLASNRTITHQELNTSGAQATKAVYEIKIDKYGHITEASTASIPDPTDYYWANVKVSSSSSPNTEPTFKSIAIAGQGGNAGTYIIKADSAGSGGRPYNFTLPHDDGELMLTKNPHIATITKSGTELTITDQDGTELTYNPMTDDQDHYPTAFSWTNGTSSGPTGSLTGNSGFSAVSFGAIPSASATQSGVVTTGSQTFGGTKTFVGVGIIPSTGGTVGSWIFSATQSGATKALKVTNSDSYGNCVINFPYVQNGTITLATTGDIPTNYVTTNTTQDNISGAKTFTNTLTLGVNADTSNSQMINFKTKGSGTGINNFYLFAPTQTSGGARDFYFQLPFSVTTSADSPATLATESLVSAHTENSNIHVTSSQKTTWNGSVYDVKVTEVTSETSGAGYQKLQKSVCSATSTYSDIVACLSYNEAWAILTAAS